MVSYIYENVKVSTRNKGDLTETLKYDLGVRQGCI